MLVPTIIMGLLALALVVYGQKQSGVSTRGLSIALRMTMEILPLLLFAFIVAGMIQVLLPKDLVARWVGTESGVRGLLIGTVAGALAPGGPYVSLPIAAGLLKAGAGVGTMVAFLTGWSLWALNRIPMDVGILGWKLTLIRFVCTFFFPPVAGLLAHALFSKVSLS
jgi:uncharacterized membrane protein YraQ (UPF0718 family)